MVGERCPEDAAADVEEREKADKARRDRCSGSLEPRIGLNLRERQIRLSDQRSAEDLLQHRRGDADHADTCRYVQHQHKPDEPERYRLIRIAHMHMARRDQRLLLERRRPPFRLPAIRRHPVAECAAQHEHEIDGRQREECLPNAYVCGCLEVLHQNNGERRADHGAAAKAHDGHSGGHAALVRKPLNESGDRRNVAEAEPYAADDARAEPHQPKLVITHAECGNTEAAAPAKR